MLVTFAKKTVVVTAESQAMLQAMADSLDGSDLSTKPSDLEEAAKEELKVDRKGGVAWFRRFFQMEKGTAIVLPSSHCLIDSNTWHALELYREYLNGILDDMGLSSADTEADELTDPAVIFRELVLRLLTNSLTAHTLEFDYGLKCLNVLESFVARVRKGKILRQKKVILEDKVSKMEVELLSTHAGYIECFKSICTFFNNLHAHETAVAVLTAEVWQIRLRSAQFLLAQLGGNLKEEDFSKDWVFSKLAKTELALITLMDAPESEKPVCASEAALEQYRDSGENVLETLSTRFDSVRTAYKRYCLKHLSSPDDMQFALNRLTRLQDVFLSATAVFQCLNDVSQMITISGWVSILTGAVDLRAADQLVGILANLDAEANSAANLKRFLSSSTVAEMVKKGVMNYVQGSRSAFDRVSTSQRVELLFAPQMRQMVVTALKRSVLALGSNQNEAIKYLRIQPNQPAPQILNSTCLKALGLGKMLMLDAPMPSSGDALVSGGGLVLLDAGPAQDKILYDELGRHREELNITLQDVSEVFLDAFAGFAVVPWEGNVPVQAACKAEVLYWLQCPSEEFAHCPRYVSDAVGAQRFKYRQVRQQTEETLDETVCQLAKEYWFGLYAHISSGRSCQIVYRSAMKEKSVLAPLCLLSGIGLNIFMLKSECGSAAVFQDSGAMIQVAKLPGPDHTAQRSPRVCDVWMQPDGSVKVLRSLESDFIFGWTSHHYAAALGFFQALQDLNPADVVINAGVPTLVHVATEYGRLRSLQVLLSRGFSAMDTDLAGRTALHIAVQVGAVDCLMLLLERVIKTDVKDKAGLTPLALAKKLQRLPCVELLKSKEK